ncbi:hypothetical protein FEM54_07745 [Pseudomonas edaphica]|uniref:Uncharacterized protein n=1 Tax=Pseudomonas edaphica TaxID=2006980 RepID=A0ABY2U8B0_9PSED|nr:hypothetical protein FEM54_07745 [Pseudomonas edaphica]
MPSTLGQSAVKIHVSGARLIVRDSLIVPTLCVGMPPWTLCVRSWDAERPGMHSHAERGNDRYATTFRPNSADASCSHNHQ